MKKILIFIVIISSLSFNRMMKTSIETINLSLTKDELGIIFISVKDNKGLLLSLNNQNILYIFQLHNYLEITNYLKPLSINIDYIIMNDNYQIDNNQIIFQQYLYLNKIYFEKQDYIMIKYNNQTLCINPLYNNCDYVYYLDELDFYINDNTKLFLYNDDINVDKIYNKWIDSYKITNQLYTILKIKDKYEVISIQKNI
ncbi:MAG: hypothetical protein IJR82_05940 [Bacilli bacterium]|nr:hypothetical protein [Bacilli bacterium]